MSAELSKVYEAVRDGALDAVLGRYGARRFGHYESNGFAENYSAWAIWYGVTVIVNASTLYPDHILLRQIEPGEPWRADPLKHYSSLTVEIVAEFWDHVIPLSHIHTEILDPFAIFHRDSEHLLFRHDFLWKMIPVMKRARIEAIRPMTFDSWFLTEADRLAYLGELA